MKKVASFGASKRKRSSSSSSSSSDEEEVAVLTRPPQPKPAAVTAPLPGKNEDLDFGEMLSLDEDYSSSSSSSEEDEDVAAFMQEEGAELRKNSVSSDTNSICTDDDVVQKRKKRNVRGLLSRNQDEDNNSKGTQSESNSKASFSSSSEEEDLNEDLEDLFDETLEEIQAQEAKQAAAEALALAASQKQHHQVRTRDVLRTVPFFAQFSNEHQEQLFSELEEEQFTDGENIVNQGELGDKFYVIVSGEAVVSKLEESTGEFRDLTHIYSGDFFGELVLIYGGQRVATVTSVGRTKCMSLSKKAFEKYADIRYFLILQKVPLLAGLKRGTQLEIVRRLKPAKFNPDELVVKQHDKGDAFFFITRGSALVIDEDDGDRVITRLYEGHSFGEMALLSDAPRVASVRSNTGSELHCMFLNVQDFKELLSADEFALLVEEESKKIRELRDKRTLFKQMRASSASSIDFAGSPLLITNTNNGGATAATLHDTVMSEPNKRYRSNSSQLKLSSMTASTSPGLTPSTPRTTAGMQQKLKTGKTVGGSRIINNYVLGEQIGKGTFGIVRLCENNGQQYAIKIIDKSLFKNKISSKHQSTMEDMRREASIMKKLDHPNVVNLIDVIDDPKAEQLYLVQEYCAGGAVMENLEGNIPLEEPLARRYFRDLLSGIDYLHAHKIIHRDIKPMNLLITSSGLLKIGDFGAARVLSNDSKQTAGIAGTPAFMAPELLGQEASLYDGPAVDLWSCGATLFMLVTGVPPWMASDELALAKRVQNDELVFPGAFATKLNPHLRNLLTRLLVKDPAQRMTLTQTMEHEWVTEEGADPLERVVTLQPQLIRINSKRIMTPPPPAPPLLPSPTNAAAAAAATTVPDMAVLPIAATAAAAMQEEEESLNDSDEEDAIITIVHNETTPNYSALRKRFESSPSSVITSATESSPIMAMSVGEDLSNIFSLSPMPNTSTSTTTTTTTLVGEDNRVRPLHVLTTSGSNAAGAASSGGAKILTALDPSDSLDYAQIDVGRGWSMGKSNAPDAASAALNNSSAGTMYSTASSASLHKMPRASSNLSHSSPNGPHGTSSSSSSSSKRKRFVVEQFTHKQQQQHVGSALKRQLGSASRHSDLQSGLTHSSSAFVTGGSSSKRVILPCGRALTDSSSSRRRSSLMSRAFSASVDPTSNKNATRTSSILSLLNDDSMMVEHVEVEGEDDDDEDEDDDDDVAGEDTRRSNASPDITIQPLPVHAVIKVKRGSAVSHCNIKYGYGEGQGLRQSMEDCIAIVPRLKFPETFFAAVFDGHNGDRVARELKARLHRALGASPDFATDLPAAIKKTCLSLDRAMLHYAAVELLNLESKIQQGDQQKSLFRTKNGTTSSSSAAASLAGCAGSKPNPNEMYRKPGSTAVMALVRGQELTVAWVGDSRGVLCRAGMAVALTQDHKADREDEKARIRANGGTVDRQGRLYGDLAVSRAFGDLQHKGRELQTIVREGATGPEEYFGAEGTLIALPDVVTVKLTPQDEFLILASDGVFDVMSNEVAVNFVRFHLHRHGDVRKAALELVDKALEMHSMDNCSAVIIAFGGSKS